MDKPEQFKQLYDINYDPIRRYVRYGNRNQSCEYPVLIQTKYSTNKVSFDEDSKEYYETPHEFDFILEGDTIYFSLIIFGIEYLISFGILRK